MNAYEHEIIQATLHSQGELIKQQAKRIEELGEQLNGATLMFERQRSYIMKLRKNKELSDEQIRAAFNQWLMLDEGVVRFDYQLKHEWVAEQWERWQQAFKLARGEE